MKAQAELTKTQKEEQNLENTKANELQKLVDNLTIENSQMRSEMRIFMNELHLKANEKEETIANILTDLARPVIKEVISAAASKAISKLTGTTLDV